VAQYSFLRPLPKVKTTKKTDVKWGPAGAASSRRAFLCEPKSVQRKSAFFSVFRGKGTPMGCMLVVTSSEYKGRYVGFNMCGMERGASSFPRSEARRVQGRLRTMGVETQLRANVENQY
jgi:hypothetical protein